MMRLKLIHATKTGPDNGSNLIHANVHSGCRHYDHIIAHCFVVSIIIIVHTHIHAHTAHPLPIPTNDDECSRNAGECPHPLEDIIKFAWIRYYALTELEWVVTQPAYSRLVI